MKFHVCGPDGRDVHWNAQEWQRFTLLYELYHETLMCSSFFWAIDPATLAGQVAHAV